MSETIKLVGRMGVVRVPLVGGPFDGESWVAVVGCPVLVPVRPPKAKKGQWGGPSVHPDMGFIAYANMLSAMDGVDDYQRQPAPRPEQRATRFALYAPRTTEDGKATLALYFVDEVTS
jgi:hypothetical protein